MGQGAQKEILVNQLRSLLPALAYDASSQGGAHPSIGVALNRIRTAYFDLGEHDQILEQLILPIDVDDDAEESGDLVDPANALRLLSQLMQAIDPDNDSIGDFFDEHLDDNEINAEPGA